MFSCLCTAFAACRRHFNHSTSLLVARPTATTARTVPIRVGRGHSKTIASSVRTHTSLLFTLRCTQPQAQRDNHQAVLNLETDAYFQQPPSSAAAPLATDGIRSSSVALASSRKVAGLRACTTAESTCSPAPSPGIHESMISRDWGLARTEISVNPAAANIPSSWGTVGAPLTHAQCASAVSRAAGSEPSSFTRTTSELHSRPPGRSTRKTSRYTRGWSIERLTTQLEIVQSTEQSATGRYSISPSRCVYEASWIHHSIVIQNMSDLNSRNRVLRMGSSSRIGRFAFTHE